MPRYIDADALKEEISRIYYLHYAKTQDKTISDFFNAVAKRIKGASTVDAEPIKHGRWIDEYNGKYANPRYICSNCKGNALYGFERDALGNYSEVQVLTEHCPHCGAKMDAEVQ